MPSQYAITIAPDDASQYFGSKDRLKRFVYTIQWLLITHVPAGITYKLNLEVSKPDQMQNHQGRLHYHGIMEMTEDQYYDYYIDWARLLLPIGRIELKPLNDQVMKDKRTWAEYCEKDREPMERQCAKVNVPYLLTDETARPKWGVEKVMGKPHAQRLDLSSP